MSMGISRTLTPVRGRVTRQAHFRATSMTETSSLEANSFLSLIASRPRVDRKKEVTA